MMVFIDTEFTEFQRPELISIGLVTEDGAHIFYAEVAGIDIGSTSSFVRTHVWPALEHDIGVVQSREQLRESLRSWMIGLNTELCIAYDFELDRTLFAEAVGERLPENLCGWRDIAALSKTATFRLAASSTYSLEGRRVHHALHDAWANLWFIVENRGGFHGN